MPRSAPAQAGARLEARYNAMQPSHTEVATLIAAPGAEPVLPAIVASLAALLHATPNWLAPGRACDLAFDGIEPETAESAARKAIGDAAVDVLVQPALGRRKRILVADLESTIIENEM